MSVSGSGNKGYGEQFLNGCKALWQGVVKGSSSKDNESHSSMPKRIFVGLLLFPARIVNGAIKGIDILKHKFSHLDSKKDDTTVAKADGFATNAIGTCTPEKRLSSEFETMKQNMKAALDHHTYFFNKKYSVERLRDLVIDPSGLDKDPITLENIDFRTLENIDLRPSNPYVNLEALGLEHIDVASMEHISKVNTELDIDSFLTRVEGDTSDVYFDKLVSGGILIGAFHGEGFHWEGAESENAAVANYASEEFQKLFPNALVKNGGNVYQTFEEVILKIHTDLPKDDCNHISSTAVISYVEQSTGLIFTATLGKSQATLYRKIEDAWKAVPLSDVETNNSRVFGYQSSDYPANAEAKPKITVCPIKQGDILVFDSNGLKKYVDEQEIVKCLKNCDELSSEEISRDLAQLALNHQPLNEDESIAVGVVRIHVLSAEES